MRTLAIACREFSSFFRLPIGWVVIALFMLLMGIVFVSGLTPGAPATLRSFFNLSVLLMIFVAPAISMRLLAEERRSGTIEPLMTAPISDWELVIGKYLGGVGFLVAMAAPTLLFVGVLELVANPDYGPILAGYLGLLLLGMVYLAVGLLASSLTSNQIVAFLGTLFFLLVMRIISLQGASYLGQPYAELLFAVSVDVRMQDFAKGIIDTSHIVFFLAASVWFLVLSVAVVEFRRWR